MLGHLVGDMSVSDADATPNGETASEDSGTAVAGAGDMDGDGLPDLLIGAPRGDDGGDLSGITHMVCGLTTGNLDLSSAHAKIVGESSSDDSGEGMAGVGNTNGDGFDDVLVGAENQSAAEQKAGTAYLLLGGMA